MVKDSKFLLFFLFIFKERLQMCIHVFFFFLGGVVVLLFMIVIKLYLILKCSVLILKFSHVLHIHNKKLKRDYIKI